MTLREPLNSLTHLAGLLLALLGGALLSLRIESFLSVEGLSALVFILGLILLYGASSLYHGYMGSEKNIKRLQVLDHSMIYVLIAATYTPICLVTLASTLGYVLLSAIWLGGLVGIILRISGVSVPRWVYTGVYLLLGWAAVFAVYPLYQALPLMSLVLLIGGGISYTIGAVIYGRKSSRLKLGPLGFHEIFHLFILLGSLLHFLMIYLYVYG